MVKLVIDNRCPERIRVSLLIDEDGNTVIIISYI
jgi:hypothetical protein